MTRGSLIARTLAVLGLAVAAAFLSGRPVSYPSRHYYIRQGEHLLHRTEGFPAFSTPLISMPLASLLPALTDCHWGIAPMLREAGFRVFLGLLLLGLEGMLGIGFFFGAASAIAVTTSRMSHPENILSLFLVLIAGLSAWRARKPATLNLALLVGALGSSLLLRSSLAFLPPLLALSELRRPPRRRAAALALLFGPYLFLLPWLYLNWTFQRRVIPFENGQASCNIVTGALGLPGTVDGPWRTLIPEAERSDTGSVLGWAARETLRHPFRYAAAVARRLGLAAFWLALFLLPAALAMWTERRRPEVRAVALLAGYFIGVHCLMSVEHRYFEPLPPLLLALAACLAERLRSKEAPAPLRPAAWVLGSAAVLATAGSAGAAVLLIANAAAPLSVDQALRRSPDDPWLLACRGRIHIQRGAALEAAEDLDRSLRLDRRSDAGLDLATAQIMLGRFDRVFAPLRDAGPEEKVAVLKAAAWLGLGRKKEARRELEAAQRLWTSRCEVRSSSERSVQALAALRAASADTFVAQVVEPVSLLWPDASKLALASLLTELRPGSVSAWTWKAGLLAHSGEAARSRAALARTLGLDPGREERLRAASLFSDMGRPELALEALKAAPEDADILLERVRAHTESGQNGQALAALDRAVRLDLPEERRLRAAMSYMTLGRPAPALEQLRRLPDTPATLIQRARALRQLGKTEAALAELRAARDKRPDLEQRREIAIAFQDSGRYAEAISLLDALIEDRPDDAGLLDSLGICQHLSGASADAVSTLERALRLDPDFLPSYATLGTILIERRRRDEAAKVFRAGLDRAAQRGGEDERRRFEDLLRSLETPPAI